MSAPPGCNYSSWQQFSAFCNVPVLILWSSKRTRAHPTNLPVPAFLPKEVCGRRTSTGVSLPHWEGCDQETHLIKEQELLSRSKSYLDPKKILFDGKQQLWKHAKIEIILKVVGVIPLTSGILKWVSGGDSCFLFTRLLGISIAITGKLCWQDICDPIAVSQNTKHGSLLTLFSTCHTQRI